MYTRQNVLSVSFLYTGGIRSDRTEEKTAKKNKTRQKAKRKNNRKNKGALDEAKKNKEERVCESCATPMKEIFKIYPGL